MLSRILNWARYHLASGRDTVCSFVADAFPLLLLFAVVGIAGSLTGLTTFTFLDDPAPARLVDAIGSRVEQVAAGHSAKIRASIEALSPTVDGIASSVAAIAQDVADLKAAGDKSGGRRNRSTSDTLPGCVRLPSGFDCDIDKLTSAARGQYTLGTGETYSAALVRHGFQSDEVAKLDERTCQQIYDGWRTLYPPEFRSVSETRQGGWTCTNGRCYRN